MDQEKHTVGPHTHIQTHTQQDGRGLRCIHSELCVVLLGRAWPWSGLRTWWPGALQPRSVTVVALNLNVHNQRVTVSHTVSLLTTRRGRNSHTVNCAESLLSRLHARRLFKGCDVLVCAHNVAQDDELLSGGTALLPVGFVIPPESLQ